MKKIISGILFLVSVSLSAQQSFSDKVIDGVMPYTKGEVKKGGVLNNPFRLTFSEETANEYKKRVADIISILSQWDGINAPRGFEADFNWVVNIAEPRKENEVSRIYAVLELKFAPYVYDSESGKHPLYKVASGVNIYINNLSGYIPGNTVVKDIYVCPRQTGSFYGAPVYRTTRGQITIVTDPGGKLFLPVSQEEYLRAAIGEMRRSMPEEQGDDEMRKGIEEAYKTLLAVDREEAEKYRREMNEQLAEMSGSEPSPLQMLISELDNMSAPERRRQAYFAIGAMEKYRNVSGLCPADALDEGEPLIRINNEIVDGSAQGEINLLVIEWERLSSDMDVSDMPQLHTDIEPEYDNVHQWAMIQLYKQKNIWQSLFTLVK